MTTTASDLHSGGTGAGGCVPRKKDPVLWFAEAPAGVELAKTLCHTCPIQPGCLAGAPQRGEPWGVWGGQLVDRGRVVARKRPRGRPRTTERSATA